MRLVWAISGVLALAVVTTVGERVWQNDLKPPRATGSYGDSPSMAMSRGHGWQFVRTIGRIDFVVVFPSDWPSKDVYREAVGKVCSTRARRDFCKVLFFDNMEIVPTSLPMTDAQARALRADWTYNGATGTRSMLWSCDIEPDRTQCFKN